MKITFKKIICKIHSCMLKTYNNNTQSYLFRDQTIAFSRGNFSWRKIVIDWLEYLKLGLQAKVTSALLTSKTNLFSTPSYINLWISVSFHFRAKTVFANLELLNEKDFQELKTPSGFCKTLILNFLSCGWKMVRRNWQLIHTGWSTSVVYFCTLTISSTKSSKILKKKFNTASKG